MASFLTFYGLRSELGGSYGFVLHMRHNGYPINAGSVLLKKENSYK
jgi:hypothetical protein